MDLDLYIIYRYSFKSQFKLSIFLNNKFTREFDQNRAAPDVLGP